MSAQQWIFDSLFLGITVGKALSGQWQVLWKFHGVKMNDSPFCLRGGFVEGFHNWLVMSSIMGPSLGSKPPRRILPTEVVMVSRYTSPMVSSFTTWLELTLERLGLNTISYGHSAHRHLPVYLPKFWCFQAGSYPGKAMRWCGWPY